MADGRRRAPDLRVRPREPVHGRPAAGNRHRRRTGRACRRARCGRRLVRGDDSGQRPDAQHPNRRRLHRLAHAPRVDPRPLRRDGLGGSARRDDRRVRGGRSRPPVRPPRDPVHRRRERLRRPAVPAAGPRVGPSGLAAGCDGAVRLRNRNLPRPGRGASRRAAPSSCAGDPSRGPATSGRREPARAAAGDVAPAPATAVASSRLRTRPR